MMSPDYFASVNGNILGPARLSFISLQCPESCGNCVSEIKCLSPCFLRHEYFLLCWKMFHTINTSIIDCHVARMTQRLKFFESLFHSYKPNTLKFGSHEMAPEQQAQTQEQHGTFPCKSHKDTICKTAETGSGNTPSNPGLSFRVC